MQIETEIIYENGDVLTAYGEYTPAGIRKVNRLGDPVGEIEDDKLELIGIEDENGLPIFFDDCLKEDAVDMLWIEVERRFVND